MGAETEFTIDELARAADTTVRSVRVYHERGLLPSPEVRGRIGYYGADHLNRLQTISRLLGRGMKLNGIRELLAAWDRGDGLADVLGVAQNAESAPPTVSSETSESPQTSDTEDHSEAPLPDYLAEALATSEDPLDLYRVTNPRCCDLATRLRDAGLPLERTFHIIEGMRAESDRLADRYAADL
ncbi:MAG: MerR family transcriptional regulator, partial [Mycobacterium sp.]|nr:MerR family transcriptional regulator [Mycobacterium sp.]